MIHTILLTSGGDVQIPYLREIVSILALSVLVIYLFRKLRLPAILGFLATGVIFGPHGLGLAGGGAEIEVLSEIGVVLLLFIIGMEFSLKNLWSIKRVVFLGGTLQVVITIFATAGVVFLIGLPFREAIMLGLLFSLSSTAIVLKILQEKGLVRKTHGRITLGILIFQDIIVVPMILMVPILSGQEAEVGKALLILALKAAVLIVMVYVSARYLVPKLMHEIARTRSRELFLITVIVICFAVAFVTSMMGLSLALGAFMAGLTISESEYSHQATGLIIPFREIFTSFFFVSIGMLLDLNFLVTHLPLILLFTVGVSLVKFNVLIFAVRILKYPIETSILVGLSLFQVGEFAFILSRTGMEYGLLEPVVYQYFLSVSILTMAATPFLIEYKTQITSALLRTPMKKLESRETRELPIQQLEDHDGLEDHLIIIGFGTNGQNAARSAKWASIPYVIVDVDADVVSQARRDGHPVVFGNGLDLHILDIVGLYRARVAVIAVPDPYTGLDIVANMRKVCLSIHIIVRTKSVSQAEEMLNAGATEAISEEFEASVEVFARMLNQFLVSDEDIDHTIDEIRKETYSKIHSSFHYYKKDAMDLEDIHARIITLHLAGPLTEKHIGDVPLLEKHKVRVNGVLRDDRFISRPHRDTFLQAYDRLIIMGLEKDLKNFMREWEEMQISDADEKTKAIS